MDLPTILGGATLATTAISTLLVVVRRTAPALAEARRLRAEERALKARARADEAVARRAEAELDAAQAEIAASSLQAYEDRLRATERARDTAQARVAVLERELRKRGITPPGGTPAAR